MGRRDEDEQDQTGIAMMARSAIVDRRVDGRNRRDGSRRCRRMDVAFAGPADRRLERKAGSASLPVAAARHRFGASRGLAIDDGHDMDIYLDNRRSWSDMVMDVLRARSHGAMLGTHPAEGSAGVPARLVRDAGIAEGLRRRRSIADRAEAGRSRAGWYRLDGWPGEGDCVEATAADPAGIDRSRDLQAGADREWPLGWRVPTDVRGVPAGAVDGALTGKSEAMFRVKASGRSQPGSR